MNHRVHAARALVLAFVVTLRAGLAQAQVDELGIGGGIAVPVYETAAVHGPGPHLHAYVASSRGPRLQLRGQLSFSQLGEESRDPSQGPPLGDLRAIGLSGIVAYSPAGTGRGMYGFAGAGIYALRSSAEAAGDPPPLVPGASAGVGVNVRLGGQALFAQAGVEVPFSTFATGTESAPNMYLPFAVGLRIPCCGGRPSRP
jgi:hypothetical protein